MSSDERSLEELFSSLKEVAVKKEANSVEETDAFDARDSDVLQLDNDDHEEGKLDTEKVFRDIELDLRKLPKLSTQFDYLATKKSSTQGAKDNNKLLRNEVNNDTKKKSVSEEWFTIPKPSDHVRKSLQRDLLLIKHRAALDPKRHYKKDRWQVPDRFSVGTIIEDKTEYFSSRINKKDRKSTMLESLMSDDTSNKYFKRKYSEIQVQKTSGKRGHFKKQKSLRRKF